MCPEAEQAVVAPPVTEREARRVAEAARTTQWEHASFARELYLGRFRPDLVWPYPELPADEVVRGEAFLADLTRHLQSVDGAAIEESAVVSDSVIRGLIDLGVMGIKIPREYGGLGLSQVYYNKALELLGTVNPSLGALASAHQSIGVPEPVKQFGTPEQKQAYLPRCAQGAISAFLLTEPDVGSDPARVQASATPTPEGDYLIDGVKLWTTNGVIAELLVVMARVPTREGHRGGVTAFVVEADSDGITVERRNAFLGLRGIENGVTRFHQVRVPAANVIGREGQGLKIALTTLNTGRLSIPALCVGAGKWCLKIAREWSGARVQWGKPIGQHGAISAKISFLAATTYAQECVVDLAGRLAESGTADIRIEAALAKLWCSEMAWQCADELVQIRGGRGYETAASLRERGERAVAAEQILRDLRINRIFEGSTEIMHLLIAREAVDTHLDIAGALIDQDATMDDKLVALRNAAKFYASWLPSLVSGAGQLPSSYAGIGPLGTHLRFVERNSRRLARNTFYGMARWQGGLEQQQLFLARIVDVGAELFAITATCVRAEDQVRSGEHGQAPRELADAFCRQSRRRVATLMRSLWANEDASDKRLAREVLSGRYQWAEDGIIDTSEGTGPWIADTTPGESSSANLRRRYR
ncbi:MAG: acyl-CoA dehydrogenase family protein [Beutenbergiaceae bacterium]